MNRFFALAGLATLLVTAAPMTAQADWNGDQGQYSRSDRSGDSYGRQNNYSNQDQYDNNGYRDRDEDRGYSNSYYHRMSDHDRWRWQHRHRFYRFHHRDYYNY